MKILVLGFLAAFMFSIAFSQKADAAYIGKGKVSAPVLNERCDRFANFAKSIATLKEVGFTVDGTKQFVVEPTVSEYPVNLVRTKVYSMTGTPQEVYQEFYAKCDFWGYDTLMKILVEEEAVFKENAVIKQKLEAMVAEQQTLLNKVSVVQKKK